MSTSFNVARVRGMKRTLPRSMFHHRHWAFNVARVRGMKRQAQWEREPLPSSSPPARDETRPHFARVFGCMTFNVARARGMKHDPGGKTMRGIIHLQRSPRARDETRDSATGRSANIPST